MTRSEISSLVNMWRQTYTDAVASCDLAEKKIKETMEDQQKVQALREITQAHESRLLSTRELLETPPIAFPADIGTTTGYMIKTGECNTYIPWETNPDYLYHDTLAAVAGRVEGMKKWIESKKKQLSLVQATLDMESYYLDNLLKDERTQLSAAQTKRNEAKKNYLYCLSLWEQCDYEG